MSVFISPLSANKHSGNRTGLKDPHIKKSSAEPGYRKFYELFLYSTRIDSLKKYLIGIIAIILTTCILVGIYELWF